MLQEVQLVADNEQVRQDTSHKEHELLAVLK
jgi:hypothetical protein